MEELGELYQAVILDHNHRPRNFGPLAGATHQARGHNPLCGDSFTIYATVEDDRITAVGFEGSGCAISQASASLMTTILKGKTRPEAEEIFIRFHEAVTGKGNGQELGKLAVFAGVAEFPMRVKCATLSWHTLREALNNGAAGAESVTVTTES